MCCLTKVSSWWNVCKQILGGGGCREYQCNRTTTGPGSQVAKTTISRITQHRYYVYLHKETIPFCKILEPLSCSTKCWETECKHKPALIDKAHLGACRIEDNELPFVQLLVNHPNIYTCSLHANHGALSEPLQHPLTLPSENPKKIQIKECRPILLLNLGWYWRRKLFTQLFQCWWNSNSYHLQVSRKPHVQLSTFSNQQSLTLPLQWEIEGRCFFSKVGDLHVDPAGKQVSLEFGNEHKSLGAQKILCVSYPSRSCSSLAPCRVLKTDCC
jgi:hypothetical protein